MACLVSGLFEGLSPARLRVLFGDLALMSGADLAWWLQTIEGLCQLRCSCVGSSHFDQPGVFSISRACIERLCEAHARVRPLGLCRVLPALEKAGHAQLVGPGVELPAPVRSPGGLRSAVGVTTAAALGAVGWVASGAATLAYDALLGGLVALSLVSPEDVSGPQGGTPGAAAGSALAGASVCAGIAPLRPGDDVVCVLRQGLQSCAAALVAAVGTSAGSRLVSGAGSTPLLLLLRHPVAPWDAACALISRADGPGGGDAAALCAAPFVGGATAPVSLPQLLASTPAHAPLPRLCDTEAGAGAASPGQLTPEGALYLVPHLLHTGAAARVDGGGGEALGPALLFGAAPGPIAAAEEGSGAAPSPPAAELQSLLRLRICAAAALVDLHALRRQEAAALEAASAASRGADREAALRHLRRRHAVRATAARREGMLHNVCDVLAAIAGARAGLEHTRAMASATAALRSLNEGLAALDPEGVVADAAAAAAEAAEVTDALAAGWRAGGSDAEDGDAALLAELEGLTAAAAAAEEVGAVSDVTAAPAALPPLAPAAAPNPPATRLAGAAGPGVSVPRQAAVGV